MQGWYYGKGLIYLLGYNKTALCRSTSLAFSFVLFYTRDFTLSVTSGYSIFSIRDPARGTSQFIYLRVPWTSAFKQFFLFLLHSVSLTQSFIMLDAKTLKASILHVKNTSLTGPLIIGAFEKRAPASKNL